MTWNSPSYSHIHEHYYLPLYCYFVLVLIWNNDPLLFIADNSSIVFFKDAFRALVGKGYLTLQSLLLDFCQRRPSQGLLYALLDMLVDGKFDMKTNSVIKVILQLHYVNSYWFFTRIVVDLSDNHIFKVCTCIIVSQIVLPSVSFFSTTE